MNNNIYLDIAPEVGAALKEGRPVVALESTIISHGMPYPQNVETAKNVENIIRSEGAVPATIAVIGGKMKVGLSAAEIEYLGKKGMAVTKASRRDLPSLAAKKMDGALKFLPPAESAAFTAERKPPWTFPPTLRSLAAPTLPLYAPAQNPSLISA